ncbi:hypothetical protein QFC19_001576 [Naganishia cerealis]|uniref:Uncharacterized protein n=1 Tax=Naganishia cerealis TaxID=610337 RepID=A0ACC2WGJ5_9TREE|nr:hypothetical protein QFC19_001576 [Naganishia cerealis]
MSFTTSAVDIVQDSERETKSREIKDLATVVNNTEGETKELGDDSPVLKLSTPSPTDLEVTVQLCPSVPKQKRTPENVDASTQGVRRHSSQKRLATLMYLVPIEAHNRHLRIASPSGNSEATSHSDLSARSRKPILRSQSMTAPPSKVEKIRNNDPSKAKVSFSPNVKFDGQSSGKQADGKIHVAKQGSSRVSGSGQLDASMQLLMRYNKELEGKRLRNERLRQKNSLHFAHQTIRWIAISHSVIFVCASIVVLALVMS